MNMGGPLLPKNMKGRPDSLPLRVGAFFEE